MIDCPKCKATIETDSWFCDQCGQELKVCPQCGAYGKGRRCTQCGTVLITAKEKTEGSSKTPENIQSRVPPPQQPAAPQPEVHHVSETNPDKTVRKPSAPVQSQNMVLKNLTQGIQLLASTGAIIGRRNGAYVGMLSSNGYVSGTHARLDYNAAGYWTITDLESTNGTFYNRVKLAPNVPCRLEPGGQVKIADLEFVVEFN